MERATQPLTVTVEALPDAVGFSGAVGRFRASASLDRDVVPLGEAATLRFRVEGTGNLKWIERGPEVVAKGARVFPPQAKSDLRTDGRGHLGSRTWEFVVVPETSGTVEVPALSFSYFDPSAGRIVAAETAPLALRVEGGRWRPGLPVPTPSRAPTAPCRLRSELDLRTAAGSRSVRGRWLLPRASRCCCTPASGDEPPSRRAQGDAWRKASPPRSVRAALRDLERAGREAASKEQAAGLVEKALHEAFGEIPDEDESERARAVRALLDDARFVRYAPQLGDYRDKVEDLAARAAEAVRRWA